MNHYPVPAKSVRSVVTEGLNHLVLVFLRFALQTCLFELLFPPNHVSPVIILGHHSEATTILWELAQRCSPELVLFGFSVGVLGLLLGIAFIVRALVRGTLRCLVLPLASSVFACKCCRRRRTRRPGRSLTNNSSRRVSRLSERLQQNAFSQAALEWLPWVRRNSPHLLQDDRSSSEADSTPPRTPRGNSARTTRANRHPRT